MDRNIDDVELSDVKKSDDKEELALEYPLIFFVHVPKTAGSTVNAALKNSNSNGVAHCESFFHNPGQLQEIANNVDWLSGHIDFTTASQNLSKATERTIKYYTCIREPRWQVASHYNWLIEIYFKGTEFYEAHPKKIKEISEIIRGSKNDSARSIIANLKKYPGLFLNFQSRFILGRNFNWNGGNIIKQLRQYEIVTENSNVKNLIKTILFDEKVNIEKKNESQYHFDKNLFNDPEILNFLEDNNTLDNILYNIVSTKFTIHIDTEESIENFGPNTTSAKYSGSQNLVIIKDNNEEVKMKSSNQKNQAGAQNTMPNQNNSTIEGYLDQATGRVCRGWAFDPSNPNLRQNINVVHKKVLFATIVADYYREGLFQKGKGDGRYEFRFSVPDGINPQELEFFFAVNNKKIPVSSPPVSTANATRKPEYTRRHPFVNGLPKIEPAKSTVEITSSDMELAERLTDAFHFATEKQHLFGRQNQSQYKGMWTHIEQQNHREIVALLQNKQHADLATHLASMHMQDTVFGISQGRRVYDNIQKNPQMARGLTLGYWDKFVSLAEALGAAPVEDPQKRGHWGKNIYRSIEEIESLIINVVGKDITPPLVASGLYGLPSAGAPYDSRTIEAIYAGWRINQLLQTPSACVCEIGAGLGWSGYYASLMGARNYWIIDLPVMNVVQGWCLVKSLPENNIILSGENNNSGDASEIRISTPESLFEGEHEISVYYNQDSFPEIGLIEMHKYIDRMKKNKNSLFLSINQESEGKSNESEKQLIVHKEIKNTGGFRQISRHLHWLRMGYVEELFAVI